MLAVSRGALVATTTDLERGGETCYRSRVTAAPVTMYAWGRPHGETRARAECEERKARDAARMYRAFSVAIYNDMTYADIVDPADSEPFMVDLWNQIKRAKLAADTVAAQQ